MGLFQDLTQLSKRSRRTEKEMSNTSCNAKRAVGKAGETSVILNLSYNNSISGKVKQIKRKLDVNQPNVTAESSASAAKSGYSWPNMKLE